MDETSDINMVNTHIERMLSGSLFILVAMIISKIFAIFVSIIRARYLGPDGLGELSIILYLQSLGGLIAAFGIPMALTKYISQYNVSDKNKQYSLMISSTIVISIITIITSSILWILAPYMSVNIYKDPKLEFLFKINSIEILIATILAHGMGLLQGLQKISLLAKINIFNAVILFPFTILFIIW